MGSANAWPKMKDFRREKSSENLKLTQLNWNLFLKCIVTGDETWTHHDDPETKQQSMQWKHTSSPSPRKFKVQASAGKIMCTVYWDAEDVLLIDYMPHKVTVTGVYYADLLHRLHVAIKQKRRGKLTKIPLLLHDNASAHAHVTCFTSHSTWKQVWGNAPSTILCLSGSKWLGLSTVSKLKETSPWSEIFERWRAQVCDRQVVNRTVRTVLFYRHLETPILI